MTQSIPLRRLKVHQPEVKADFSAVRGKTPANLMRPSFAELLRAPPRLPNRRPSSSFIKDQAAQTGAQLLIQEDRVEPIDPEQSHITQPLSAIDTATEDTMGGAAHRLNDFHTPTEPQSSDPLDVEAIDAVQADQRGHLITKYVAATVSNFCNDPAVQDGDGWTVRLALNEAILPSTTVHLSLSLHWLLLRFDCGEARSRQVIAQHRGTLQIALEEAIVPRREVSIDFD